VGILHLTTDEVRDILQLTSHAMLRAVRVVLANGSLAEARDLQKMLTKAISVVEEEWNIVERQVQCPQDG